MNKYEYTPTTWIGGKTIGTADVMNNIEEGIMKAHEELEEVNSQLEHVMEDGFNLSQIYCNNPDCTGGCGKVKGDDVHNDTSGFKYVLNDLNQSHIILPKGTYKLTESLEISRHILIEGYNIGYNGAMLKFYGTSGLIIKKPFVALRRISLMGNYKQDSNVISIPDKQFGFVGINFVYNDKYTSSAIVLEDITIENFNVGLATYEEGSQIWAGAYREFKNCNLVKNDIHYYSSKVTHDKFFGGHFNHAYMHPFYVTSNGIESNIEFLSVSFDGNRDVKTVAICEGQNTTVNIENAYIEWLDLITKKEGTINIRNTFMNNNVSMFGQGVINMDNSWGAYEAPYKFVFGKDRTWGNNVETSNTSDYSCNIFSNGGASYKSVTGFVPLNAEVSLNTLRAVKLSFKYKISSGQTINNFAIKPGFVYVEKESKEVRYINSSDIIDIETMPYDTSINEGNFEVIYCLDRVNSFDRDAIISEFRFVIKFDNSINGEGNTDFSAINLDMDISNLCFSLYSNTNLVNLNKPFYLSDITKLEEKLNKKSNYTSYSGTLNPSSSATITLSNNNYRPRIILLSGQQAGSTNIGVDIVALVYASEWLGKYTLIAKDVRSSAFDLDIEISKLNLTITNNNSVVCGYTLKDCLLD